MTSLRFPQVRPANVGGGFIRGRQQGLQQQQQQQLLRRQQGIQRSQVADELVGVAVQGGTAGNQALSQLFSVDPNQAFKVQNLLTQRQAASRAQGIRSLQSATLQGVAGAQERFAQFAPKEFQEFQQRQQQLQQGQRTATQQVQEDASGRHRQLASALERIIGEPSLFARGASELAQAGLIAEGELGAEFNKADLEDIRDEQRFLALVADKPETAPQVEGRLKELAAVFGQDSPEFRKRAARFIDLQEAQDEVGLEKETKELLGFRSVPGLVRLPNAAAATKRQNEDAGILIGNSEAVASSIQRLTRFARREGANLLIPNSESRRRATTMLRVTQFQLQRALRLGALDIQVERVLQEALPDPTKLETAVNLNAFVAQAEEVATLIGIERDKRLSGLGFRFDSRAFNKFSFPIDESRESEQNELIRNIVRDMFGGANLQDLTAEQRQEAGREFQQRVRESRGEQQ